MAHSARERHPVCERVEYFRAAGAHGSFRPSQSPNHEIAEFMHVSVNTVDKHSAHLMRKLDIHDRVELARFAIRKGLSEP